MARCFVLDDFSVADSAGRCRITLDSTDFQDVNAFAEILHRAFPNSDFQRTPTPSRSGILALRETVNLEGKTPASGAEAIRDFLGLLTKSLTIEDNLDECHALGYHREPDEESGQLTRTTLGNLVNRAKYGNKRPPRETIGAAVADFIKSHPRYSGAATIGCVPRHKAGDQSSLSSRILNQVCPELDLDVVPIVRVVDRPEQKEITDDNRREGVRKRIANQEHSMNVEVSLSATSVIIIDDLYGSGGSMQEAARCLRQAGATEVLGLAITKQHLFEGVRLTPEA